MGKYRTRKNEEIRELYKEPDVVAIMKRRRIQCLRSLLKGEGKIYKEDLPGKVRGKT